MHQKIISRFNACNKTKTFMNPNKEDNSIPSDLSNVTGCEISIVEVFKNKAPLSLNHWYGVVRLQEKDGSFCQYYTDTAANSKSRAIDEINYSVLQSLLLSNLDISKNKINIPVSKKTLNRLNQFAENSLIL